MYQTYEDANTADTQRARKHEPVIVPRKPLIFEPYIWGVYTDPT
jgi:hypothetical protein